MKKSYTNLFGQRGMEGQNLRSVNAGDETQKGPLFLYVTIYYSFDVGVTMQIQTF